MNRFAIPLFTLAAFASAKFPFLIYVVTLAFFGIPHVLREYRYVAPRIGAVREKSFLYGLMGAVVAIRAIGLFFPATFPYGLELGLGFGALGLFLAGTGSAQGATAIAIAIAIAAIGLFAPAPVFIIFAFAHNLIAVGVLATARRIPRAIVYALALAPLVFALAGSPSEFDRAIGGARPEDLLAAYLPSSLWFGSLGYRVFSVAAYLQIVHYACILGYLPVPSFRFRDAVLNPYALAATTAFFADFATTRSFYALPAGFHAWFELPLLALAFIPGTSKPALSRPRIPRSGVPS
ncbi:MAG: hypothetical protein JST04_12155 [Bdellovibrionales bacterium]|nr:hypothetical protein [Bdellovibrionales bacterium]